MGRLPRLTEVFRVHEADLDIDRFTRKYADSPVGNPDPMGSKQRDVSRVGSPVSKKNVVPTPAGLFDFKRFSGSDPAAAKEFEEFLEEFKDGDDILNGLTVDDFVFDDMELYDQDPDFSWVAWQRGGEEDEPLVGFDLDSKRWVLY